MGISSAAKRKVVNVVLVVVCVLFGCMPQEERAMQVGSPRTGPEKPHGLEVNPFYAAWASFKVRTETDYQLSVTKEGVVTTFPLYYVLAETNPEEVMLELNFPANRRVLIPAHMGAAKHYAVDNLDAQPDLVGALGWPALLYQLAYPPFVKTFSGRESVVAAGKSFDCRYGVAQVLGMKLKQWFSPEVPGGLVKAAAVYNPEQTAMELTLVQVTTRQ